ncbi:MAG: hypothetical protein CND84_04995 [Marine Group II euryarchaeote MED-G35]|nr:MAG: hypothetical protein CND84_04995 [Marine Group II euryarchaeote MED-G35]
MPKPKKAARGKHRWIGFRIENTSTREELKRLLKANLRGSEWRLFDMLETRESTLAILKTPLGDFQQIILQINNSEGMETLTSSGKIRLVRKRLNETLGNDPSDTV